MRLFLAIPLPAELRTEIARRSDALHRELPRARWVPPGSMHLTLHFFGEREADRALSISNALSGPLEHEPAFTLHLASVGAFPRRSRPQVLWLGLDESARLSALHETVRAVLHTLEEPIDTRPFRGHVTLLRCKQRFGREHVERVESELADLAGEEIPVSEVVLFESHLGPRGAAHEVVTRLPLGSVSLLE